MKGKKTSIIKFSRKNLLINTQLTICVVINLFAFESNRGFIIGIFFVGQLMSWSPDLGAHVSGSWCLRVDN